MARPFSYPEVQQLEVGQHTLIEAPVSEVRRKVALYAARAGKDFIVDSADAHTGPERKVALVTRIDPEPRAE